MLGCATIAITLWTMTGVPLAHPLSNRLFDRAIQATVFRDKVAVEYTLGVNDLTLMTELLGLVETGKAPASPAAARVQYAEVVQPILLRGINITLDGMPLEMRPVGSRINLLDHVEYIFRWESPPLVNASVRSLAIHDVNFPGERGFRRLAVAAGPGVRLHSKNVATDVAALKLIPSWEMTPEQEDAASRAVVAYQVDESNTLATNQPLSVEQSSRNIESSDASESSGLRELLANSRIGFAATLALAFVFGMLHAIKPGHGKTMVAAYLVGQQGTVYHAILLGLVTALTHTGTVLFVAFMLRPFAGSRWVDQETLSFWLTLISGIAIVWLGGALLWRRLRGKEDVLHVHGPGGHVHMPDGSVRWESRVSTASLLTLGFSGGLIPCDDAVLLLLAAIGAGMLSQAVFILLAFSAGLAAVLVLIGILVVKLRGFAVRGGGSERVMRSLQVVSALAISAVGVGLCIAAFRSIR